ncbi:hypothetical protein GGR50DRAFT_690673 [Xylaria sp. CBS 124048]|nr:hypothetical protein GGR50DRAFT_690673 [Xylaria sp. CBS 124048]
MAFALAFAIGGLDGRAGCYGAAPLASGHMTLRPHLMSNEGAGQISRLSTRVAPRVAGILRSQDQYRARPRGRRAHETFEAHLGGRTSSIDDYSSTTSREYTASSMAAQRFQPGHMSNDESTGNGNQGVICADHMYVESRAPSLDYDLSHSIVNTAHHIASEQASPGTSGRDPPKPATNIVSGAHCGTRIT